MNLTQEEYKQLEAIRVLYPWARYIARDLEHELIWAYENKPLRDDAGFYGDRGMSQDLPDETLPSLTWESEPLNIDEALKEKYSLQSIGNEVFERICEEVHNAWWEEKKRQGVTNHPDMIPYRELDENIKDYDRATVRAVLRAMERAIN